MRFLLLFPTLLLAATYSACAIHTPDNHTSENGRQQTKATEQTASEIVEPTKAEQDAVQLLVQWLTHRGLGALRGRDIPIPERDTSNPSCISTVQGLLKHGPTWIKTPGNLLLGHNSNRTMQVHNGQFVVGKTFVKTALAAPYNTLAELIGWFAHYNDAHGPKGGCFGEDFWETPHNLRALKASTAFLKATRRFGELEPLGTHNLLLHEQQQRQIKTLQGIWHVSAMEITNNLYQNRDLLETLEQQLFAPFYLRDVIGALAVPGKTNATSTEYVKWITQRANQVNAETLQWQQWSNEQKALSYKEHQQAFLFLQNTLVLNALRDELDNVKLRVNSVTPSNQQPHESTWAALAAELAKLWYTQGNLEKANRLQLINYLVVAATANDPLIARGNPKLSLPHFHQWLGKHHNHSPTGQQKISSTLLNLNTLKSPPSSTN